ncbi:hypothetical protein LH51_11625 [Nitrincola sp. A-D6]|uniref:hypothetical protein n=1 Tax=Nitrincola sp. A-D6 TaxID=1545442 RepID=UPI00051F9335|nr:hypothetical protein [Nitrincola sp. A-D6]KGK41840.1 hypothetical protein LH51_11625 [Nitrincola sp. A-D6]
MNNFFIKSKNEYIQKCTPIIDKIPKTGSIGIFGVNCPARLIDEIMDGYPDCYIATRPIEKELYGKKVIDIDESSNIDAIILSSLSNQEQQLKVLKEKQYKGKIYTLPNMAHLSTFMQNDFKSTKNIDALFYKHTNNPALIIGNGPSFEPEIISNLKNKNLIKFGCNGILSSKQNIDIDYYFLLDQFSVYTWRIKYQVLIVKY